MRHVPERGVQIAANGVLQPEAEADIGIFCFPFLHTQIELASVAGIVPDVTEYKIKVALHFTIGKGKGIRLDDADLFLMRKLGQDMLLENLVIQDIITVFSCGTGLIQKMRILL